MKNSGTMSIDKCIINLHIKVKNMTQPQNNQSIELLMQVLSM